MVESRIPLLNARGSDGITFGNTYRLRSATPKELERWGQDPYVRDVVPHRVFPEIRSVLVVRDDRIATDRQFEIDDELMVWFGATALYAGRPVEAAFSEEWLRGDNEPADGGEMFPNIVKYFYQSLPVAGLPPWNGPIILDGRIGGMTEKALQKFRSGHAYAPTFRFALSRWYYSQNRRRRLLEDAVLDLAIALEALFIPEDDRGDRAKAVRERVSRCWTSEPKKIREIKAKLVKAYDVRSRIIHGTIFGESGPFGLTELKEAETVLGGLLAGLLRDFIAGRLDDFNPHTYWNAPQA